MKKKLNKKTARKDRKDIREFRCNMHGTGSAVYGLGFIGALVYYITTATSLWAAFIGIFKALLWPAFIVYEALKFLGM